MPWREMVPVWRRHASEVKRKITDFRKIGRILKDIASQCEGGELLECPVIDALFGDTL